MEPDLDVFDKTHTLFDSHGNSLPSLSELSFRKSYQRQHSNMSLGVGEYNSKKKDEQQQDGAVTALRGLSSSSNGWSRGDHSSHLVHSVLMAEGVHYQIEDEELDALPRRFDAGSSKARLTWFGALCLAGIGMFVEAYIIITTGQIKTIWHYQYPECWIPDQEVKCPQNMKCCGLHNTTLDTCTPNYPDACNDDGTYKDTYLCNENVLAAISYSEFAGIILGMLCFGAIADVIGRNSAGIITSLLMITGVTVMTFFDSISANTLFTVFAVFFGIFGLGVGGEYPLSASGAAAHHKDAVKDAELDDEERRKIRVMMDHERTVRRGETIALVFAMQGLGAVVGSTFIIFLIYFSRQGRSDCDRLGSNATGYDANALNVIWRSFYLIGGIFVAMLLLYRFLVVDEGDDHLKLLRRKLRRETKLGDTVMKKRTVLWFYASRLVGTGGNWFAQNVAFYGLKLFSGPIFAQINPSGDLIVQMGYLLVNNISALAGYYGAALVIDRPAVGRVRLQMASFLVCAIIFFATGAIFDTGSSQVLMTLYFLSSFVVSLGANATTYVMAAETYPTELRATCHGMSACMGKTGALLATIVFSYVSTTTVFYICGAVSVLGVFFTMLFSVELNRVSLAEHDAQLELLYEGRPEAYKGKLNAPEHLSLWERLTGRHGEYDPGWVKKLVEEERAKSRRPPKSAVSPEEQAIIEEAEGQEVKGGEDDEKDQEEGGVVDKKDD